MSCGAAAAAAMIGTSAITNAQITPGNIVVVRMGDGVAALGSTATPAFLEEYTTGGVAVQTIPLPTAVSGANRRLTNSGSATSEGFLTLSADGQYLICAGYDAALGTVGVAGTASATVNRVIARIDLNENIDTSTALTDAYSAGNIRSATSNDGLEFWTAGSNSGARYAAALGATTTTQLSTTLTNLRVIGLYSGQLYVSSASGLFQGVSTVGTGTPTTSGQTITLLPGFPTATGPSSYEYFFADASTLYVADDRIAASGGGIQKWTLSAGTWSLAYTINGAGGCRGLSGVVNGGSTTLFATTTASNNNTAVSVTDTGAASLFTTIAAAGTNKAFRGIRIIPSACTAPSIAGGGNPANVVACAGSPASFSVTANGSATLTYQWYLGASPLSNGGNISGATSATLNVNPIGGGDFGSYTCVVTNGCGNVTSGAATLSADTTDTDTDGTPDCTDGCPTDPNKVAAGVCGCGVSDVDTDADGAADCIDGCPLDANKIAAGICGCGVSDVDSDADGTADCLDGCPADANKIAPGICGCGVPDADSDGDGTLNCLDGCPNDANKVAPGQCGCGFADTDTDGDGSADCVDGCPADANKTAPGVCGCGTADTDSDGDGVADCIDNCDTNPNPGQADCDGDGIGDVCEIAAGASDTNLNGIPDSCEFGTSFNYCTAGTSSHGCVPTMSASGTPSAAATSGYTLTTTNLEGQKFGLMFYGITGTAAFPWGTGSSFLCVKSPTQRIPSANSGGTTKACNGSLSVDFLAYAAANPLSLGMPLAAGEVIDVQTWYRDPPASKTTNLSNGLQFTVAP
jgi:hypothetical protein